MAKPFEANCPKCGAEMQQVAGEGMVVEYCPNCHGMFLDYTEMDNPANRQFIASTDTRKDAADLNKQVIACPKCNAVMKKRRYLSKLGLLLDVCPPCHGIWFDQNELAQYCHPIQCRWRKPHKMRTTLYCSSCGIETTYDLSREKPFTCPQCGAPLCFLAKGVEYKNQLEPEMAKPLFSVFLGLLIMECTFLLAVFVFKNSRHALLFAGTVGMVAALIIVRAVVYGKFAWSLRMGRYGVVRDFDV
jgi:Zn-finger nucleic acid-binding protein